MSHHHELAALLLQEIKRIQEGPQTPESTRQVLACAREARRLWSLGTTDAEEARAKLEADAAALPQWGVYLESSNGKKIQVIKEYRARMGVSLKEAHQGVERAPGCLLRDLVKEVAEDLANALNTVGATARVFQSRVITP